MKKILYLTNIEVPYRVRFFNELAKRCELTVMYERRKSANRDNKWAHGEEKHYSVEFLDGWSIGDENGFSLRILSLLRKDWDLVVVGCYNSFVQVLAMSYMKLRQIPYFVNLDGEPFIGKGLKAYIKKSILHGANGYLTAGIKAGASLQKAIGHDVTVIPYYFSSLLDEENALHANHVRRNQHFVLVVGQFFDYKGMDIAFQVACMDRSIRYKFVGMGKRTELFRHEMGQIPDNIEVIPFMQKKELEEAYLNCELLLLPTRKECWGLVVNEAASFGTPIVSTWGSGAAIEFIGDSYPQYLAKPGDATSLLDCIHCCLNADNTDYAAFLKSKSKNYSIERSVAAHMKVFEALP